MNKEVRQLIRQLRAIDGVTVENSRNQHYRVRLDGVLVTTLPGSPSDHKWLDAAKAALKRGGVILDQQRPKRSAGGQSPPPLPDNLGVVMGASVSEQGRVEKELHQDALRIMQKVVNEIADLNGLKARKLRVVPHGTTPRLARIIYDYHVASGKPVPHLNYDGTYDTTDMREMARLAASTLTDIVGHPERRSFTHASYEKAIFAGEAWDWYLNTPADVPAAQEPHEPTVEEVGAAPGLAKLFDQPAVFETNGQGDPMLVYRVLAKLAGHGVPEAEAISLAIEVRDAIR